MDSMYTVIGILLNNKYPEKQNGDNKWRINLKQNRPAMKLKMT
jgi:hypothetical protein